ncbi:unnamed protein product, partial [Timema podura]|nr:unnamed protein product [Timema podura]
GLGGCATPNPLSPSKCHSCYLVTVGKILLTEKLPMALAENSTQDHQASSQVRRPLHYENGPANAKFVQFLGRGRCPPTNLDCAVDSLELQPAWRLQAQSSPTIHSRWQVEGVVSHCSVVMLSIAVIWWTREERVQNTGGWEKGSQDTSVQNMLKAARNRVFNFKGHEAAFPFDHRTIFTGKDTYSTVLVESYLFNEVGRHSHLFNSVCTLKGGHYYIVTLLALVGWVSELDQMNYSSTLI